VGDLRHTYFSILNIMVNALNELGSSPMVLDRIVFNEDVFDYFDDSLELGEFLVEAMKSAIQKVKIVKPEDQQKEVMLEIQKFIELNYHRELSTFSLATQFGFNPNYLSSRFKAKAGITLTSYINEVRINAACRILTETSKSVLQISEMVGFKDSSYFHKVFKNIKGLSPREFKNQ